MDFKERVVDLYDRLDELCQSLETASAEEFDAKVFDIMDEIIAICDENPSDEAKDIKKDTLALKDIWKSTTGKGLLN